jgi:hypothetical protein
MVQLFDFQEADVRAFLEHDGSGFMAAETGAGKTYIGVETLRRSGARTKLIIAPQGTHRRVWERSINELDPGAQVSIISGSAPGRIAMDDLEWGKPGYYLMSPQLFTRWEPLQLMVDFTIVDEAHLLGNRDSKGGRLLRKFARRTGSRIPMSGTLWRNSFENAWNLARFVYPDRSDARDIADDAPNRWIDTYCATEYDHFAPGRRRVVGELNEGEFAGLVPCWRQHFKREACCEFHPRGFLADLPEPIQMVESVELVPEQRAAISQMENDYVAWLDRITADWEALPRDEKKRRPLVVKLPVVRETRLRQMALAVPSIEARLDRKSGIQERDKDGVPLWDVKFDPQAKSPKLDKLIEIWQKVNEPVVASTSSQKWAEMAVGRLNAQGIRAFEWSSKHNQTERDQALADFEAGLYDIIIGVVEAIGTGIDGLQLASGVLVSIDKSRDLTSEIQLEGRLDRRGQKRESGVLHYTIIAEGTADEGIISKQLEKRLSLNKSLRRQIGVAA